MRKISIKATKAFYNKRVFNSPNTRVSMDVSGNPQMFLWGNRIAWVQNGFIWFSLCGWNSVTTKERLRSLGIDITCRNRCLYNNGLIINDYGDFNSGLCLNQKPYWIN